jgi:hypothetical protein
MSSIASPSVPPENPAPERPAASIPQNAAEAAALPAVPLPDGGRFDVLVVGGGPAGLSCGIWLGRYLHSVAHVDSGDPRNWETRGVNGFLGQPHVQPCELRESGRDECRKYGVALVDACVDRVTKHDDEHFELTLQDGRALHGRRLCIGIGIRDVWPVVPGLGRVYGNRAHVMTQALARHFPAGSKWRRPSGSPVLWVRVPDGVCVRALFEDAMREGVSFAPGEAFFVEPADQPFIRLNCAALDEKSIQRGVARLGALLHAATNQGAGP